MEEESYSPMIRSEKKKSKKKKERNPEPEMEVEIEEEEDHVIRSEKKKKNKERTLVVAEMEDDAAAAAAADGDDEIRSEEIKKKKKKKKNKNRDIIPVEEMEMEMEMKMKMELVEVDDEDTIITEEKKKKKKKRKEKESYSLALMEVEEMEVEEEEEKKEKKKKKKKEKIDVKMEIITEDKELAAPFVGYFPSGYDVQKATHEPDVKVYRHTQRSNRVQLVVSPKNSNIDFVGTSYTGEATASSQVCTYALGVLDKETQCLKIVPIACNKIFRLEPRVVGSDSYEKALVVKEEPLTIVEKAERIKILTIGLGTKGSRRKAEKAEKMKLKESASVQKDMEKKIKNVVVNKEALEITAAVVVRNIPPHDSTAIIPEQVYPLEKIILQSEWHYLRDVLQCVQSENEVPSDVYPTFVCNRAQKLLEIEDEMKRETHAGILSFITHLVKFKDQQSFDTKELVRNHRVPGILFEKFKMMFTDPGVFRLSNEKKDLLISYVLVLTLHADDFKTDPTDIAKDLRLTKISLRPYFLSLGCKISKVDRQDVMTLSAPLEFAKPSRRRH